MAVVFYKKGGHLSMMILVWNLFRLYHISWFFSFNFYRKYILLFNKLCVLGYDRGIFSCTLKLMIIMIKTESNWPMNFFFPMHIRSDPATDRSGPFPAWEDWIQTLLLRLIGLGKPGNSFYHIEVFFHLLSSYVFQDVV